MNLFDRLALAEVPPETMRRLSRRHRLVVEPFRAEIADARVLDLGAHDGRWCIAFAEAGAREVVGVEPRAAARAGFARFPASAAKERVRLLDGEAIAALEILGAEAERFDVVAVLGLFYHLMDHFRLL